MRGGSPRPPGNTSRDNKRNLVATDGRRLQPTGASREACSRLRIPSGVCPMSCRPMSCCAQIALLLCLGGVVTIGSKSSHAQARVPFAGLFDAATHVACLASATSVCDPAETLFVAHHRDDLQRLWSLPCPVRELHLSGISFTPDDVERLGQISGLTQVEFHYCRFPAPGFRCPPRWTSLERLALIASPVSRETLSTLLPGNACRELDLRGSLIEPDALFACNDLSGLERIDLRSATVSPADLETLFQRSPGLTVHYAIRPAGPLAASPRK